MSLVINYLEIENFKSYYGKNTLGPFHQSFNAVIGPNGSGKSNVIDSLLFVFGFRAQKIRTKKISVLIHNSDQHPNVTSCSVTIYFRKVIEKPSSTATNGSSQFEIVPNSEFTVKRTAYKDNSSEYFIDDRKVQFKEVGTLLRDCGVDLDHNRFLILQGEVESISLLKPKAANEHEEGLLEYLEDIIGTIRYKPMLEEIAVEIDKTNEIRTEKANRVENLKKDKNNLEGPKNEALNYLKSENQLIEKKNLYYQVKINDIEKMLSERNEEFEQMQNELNQVNAKLEEFVKENELNTNECSTKKKEFEKKSKLSEKLKKKFEDFEKEDVRLNQELKHAKEQIKKLEKSIEAETSKIETYKEIPERNEKLISEKQEELEELKNQLEPANKLLNEKMDMVNSETKKYQEKKESLQEELNKLQTSSNEAKSKMDIAQSELDVYLSSQTYEQNKLEETREKLKDLNKLYEKREKDIKKLESDMPQQEKEFNKKNDELNKLLDNEKNINLKLSTNRQKYADAQTSYSSSRNRKGVLSFLLQLKSEGKLNGLHGRLGDLGAIDEKYDVAVSTACGALDCIVVDTIDTAQKCVEQLKINNVGSATFIALDKQEKWREQVNKKIATPENVSRLVDLIKVKDPKFLTAFYYSLRNTLVANDLEQATRIAYGQSTRNRVVTLKGEIIETSGTMSGGGQPQRGRMGNNLDKDGETTHYTIESLKRMQDGLKDYENELRVLINRKLELEPEVYELKTNLEDAKQNLVKWRMEMTSLKEQLKNLKQIEADCLKRLSELSLDPAKQANLENILNESKQKFEKADKLAAKLRDENDELHNKILEISKKILNGPKEKLQQIEKQINECDTSLTSLAVEIKTSKRNLINSEKKLAAFKEDFDTNQNTIKNHEKRLESMDEEGKELIEQHEQAKQECKELEAEINKMSKSIKEIDSKKQKLESERIDHTHNLEKVKTDLHGLENEKKHYSSVLNSLKLHDIESLSSLEANQMDESSSPSIELKKIESDDLEGVSVEHLKKEIQKLEENLKAQTPNLQAIQNYRELQIKFMERVNELDEITNTRDQLCNKFEELRKKRLDEFMGGFTSIRLKLKEIYRTVTLEGDAELELVDSLDPFTEGIVLSVRPPKKSWKNVSNLSGGEKTLSSLSLVFALHEFRATPIYVMDEIDAALDFKNVSIIAHYIKERTKNAQFIIISLRNNMFELCDRLFGIYKVKNCTSATYIAPELLELDEKKKKTKQQTNKANQNSNTQNVLGTVSQSFTNENMNIETTFKKSDDMIGSVNETMSNNVF